MSLDQVPDEIIQHLLYYVSPEDTLHCFQLLCRHFHGLANESLLWRYHCWTTFKYWHPLHDFGQKLHAAVARVDWKHLFLLRVHKNRIVSRRLDAILQSRVGRLKNIETIRRLGYDAKDFLLAQCHVHESAPDVLARRYFSNAILDSIHRSIAIEEWYRLSLDRESLPAQAAALRLERALGAFDMFVLHDQPGDLDDIHQILDDMVIQFRISHATLSELTTRETALALNRWMRANNLTGLRNPERNYRNLRNCFLGQALRHEDHESIPLVSSAMFCCLAARLGLNAQCCAFPTHVHAIVFPQSGQTLDGHVVDGYREQTERMYLDPYGLDNEVPASDLQNLLAHYGWQTSTDAFLAPVPPVTMVLRTAQNIKSAFARILELQNNAHPELSQLLRGNSAMNVDAALYSAMWASLILTPPNTFEWDDRLASFLRRFAGSWPEDALLVEQYLLPMYNSFTPFRDEFARQINRELGDPWDHWLPFKIGEVFRHKRYGWIGVITGWSSRDKVDGNTGYPDERLRLPVRPANQFYFMCFPSTGSEPHVVAADNIELIHDSTNINDSMFPMAGKFFRRFDPELCRFVSNIKEEYPDD
ncbi:hypothetical protein ED733_007335 [Metarhizium rileyi]|uniref:F-box domain-containing protein n=1 Tax=Metarhizium rileyi (strain RCEF 4871) TaxID=1649241 RepID=A0A5C6GL87_METRR|nr:hypothetical protein ED733_007335 [Metarhizium rileyi]